MKSKEAKELFHGKDKLNCAQAILKSFQAELNISNADIAAASVFGGGRVDGGVCGALHAVKILINDPEIMQVVESAFEAEAGSLSCKEIRKLKKLPCRDCVGLAAKLLEKHLKSA